MFKSAFSGIAVLLLAGIVFGDAYKWVDETGVVHYSDRPEPGAEQFVLPSTRRGSHVVSVAARPVGRSRSEQKTQSAEERSQFSYESLVIVAPAAEETLWNIESVLNVTLDLRPALQQGHSVRVYFDGTPQLMNSANFQIPAVFRGVHNLQVEVLDETGKLMIRSLTNRFYVQQNVIAR